MWEILLAIGFVAVLAIIKMRRENKQNHTLSYPSQNVEVEDDDERADPKIIEAINSAKNLNELMGIAVRVDNRDQLLCGEENDCFLRMILPFRTELSRDDWVFISGVAGADSELEIKADELS